MINAFVWSDRFATGIESVDTQHEQLVGIVNQVGDLLVSGDTVSETELQIMFKRLADYARFHFADEEGVMVKGGLDNAHIELHRQHHRSFTEQLVEMWKGRSSMSQPAETLHGFLTAWLTYHILGEDQAMARELARIGSGMSAAEAHELEVNRGERSTSALLQALQNLYGVLSQQNRDLAKANLGLEARVAQRTEELNSAYERLALDNKELNELLGKVEQTQNQLIQSEKMASIGQLAAGVAHEINNPIGFVNSNLGTLGRYVEDLLRVADAASDCPAGQAMAKEIDLPFVREDLAALIKESSDGLERVRKIVANLKDFSHVDQADWQHADLIAGLESTINVVWHELKYKTEIVRDLQPLPLVRCIPAQINQVFMNLLLNAAQAIPERGVITLTSGQATRPDGEQIWIEVADTGAGMSEEIQRRMFDPFYTTKPVGTGTGLGLSVSYDTVHKHGGSIEVKSSVGVGTRMRMWLPVAGPTNSPGDEA